MPFRTEPDDEVRWFSSKWLGPAGYSFWHARYTAYAMFAVIFTATIIFKALTPLEVGLPPVWEVALSVLATSIIMTAVDHDRPVDALAVTLYRVLTGSPTPSTGTLTRRPVARRIKITRDPL